ncbi:MAG: acetyl-CoA hydrolase, partial [Pseudomonadota bacterium]|nr:acetyl-CoA hydrolase [Pseudomonadota bacterium]
MSLRLHQLSQLDITRYVRAGDLVSWGQAMAEPRGLLAAYFDARHNIGPTRAFAGLSLTGDLKPVHCDVIKVLSYGALGSTAALVRQDLVDLYPCRYVQMPALIRQGQLRPDVLLLQLSPPGPDGRHSLGFN